MVKELVNVDMLRRWSAQASTLEERLSGGFIPQEGVSAQTSQRFDKWLEIVAKGDADEFRQNMALRGLSEVEVLPLLGRVKLTETARLPTWAENIPRLLDLILSVNGQSVPESTVQEPFVHLFLPLSRSLSDNIAKGWDKSRWNDSVCDDLSNDLLYRIAPPFAFSLYSWFKHFRTIKKPYIQDSQTEPSTKPTTLIYDAYIDWLRSSHLIRLLDKHPVLARLLAVATEQWEQFIRELVSRLETDFVTLVNFFFDGRDPGQVVRLEMNISDPHDRGRGVVILHFSSGDRLVYKPRDLTIDKRWNELISWMNLANAPYDLRGTKVLCGQGYGWVDYVDNAPCGNEAEIRAFFHRAGALLGLIHVLGGTDFHQENVVANSGYPIPIDLETLLRPKIDQSSDSEAHPALVEAQQRISRSVLASGYLPCWKEFRGNTWATGGLSQLESTATTVAGFQYINTDAMCLGRVPLPDPSTKHLPHLDGAPVYSFDYTFEIESGFRETCYFLIAHRDVFAHKQLATFRNTVIRLVRQETQLYKLLQQRALQPAMLADGIDFSLEFEFLSRLHDQLDGAALAQVRAECRAMCRLDIPLFRMHADSTIVTEADGGGFDLAQDGKPVLSPFEHTLTRLNALDEADIEQQCEFIRFALGKKRQELGKASRWSELSLSTWSSSAAIKRAVELGDWIIEQAIVQADGAAWLGAVAVGIDERIQLMPIGYDLYSGAGGIASFLAALYRITEQKRFRDFCLKTFAPLRHDLAQDSRARTLARTMGIGGATGLGSVVYALVLTASLAEMPQLLDDARHVAKLFTESVIASDCVFDVVGGAAGAILGLLTLHDATGDTIALEKATACGWHLLRNHRVKTGGEGESKLFLAGFSHGAGGIAYALERLADASGEKDFSTAAMEWIAYERGLFDSNAGNWLDLRFQTKESPHPEYFVCNWCHGAAGIGLARLGLGSYGTGCDREMAAEIELAVARAIEEPISSYDILCCGNFGRLELLLYAGRQLERPHLISLARERAALRLQQTNGGFHWFIGTDAENIGFFQGLAGIGYELLRLSEPKKIPSTLLWQA